MPQYNAAMHKPVILRGPIPTPEQMADELGVSRSHLEELRKMLEEKGFFNSRANSPKRASRSQVKKVVATKRTTSGAKRV